MSRPGSNRAIADNWRGLYGSDPFSSIYRVFKLKAALARQRAPRFAPENASKQKAGTRFQFHQNLTLSACSDRTASNGAFRTNLAVMMGFSRVGYLLYMSLAIWNRQTLSIRNLNLADYGLNPS
jgi:hypothetical protein